MALLGRPYVEAVVHDLSSGRILHIANPLSKRRPGEESLLEELREVHLTTDNERTIFGPYEKRNWDGRRMKSISVLQRGKPDVLFCINVDVSAADHLQDMLALFTMRHVAAEQPKELFRNDWREQINSYAHMLLTEAGASAQTASRELKREIVRKLEKEGALSQPRAVEHTAQVLRISRATVYNYLRDHTAS